MKKILVILALACGLTANAQNSGGGISETMLNEIRQGYTGTASEQAMRNAISGTALYKLAKNADNMAMIDTHFSNEVKTEGRTDQHSSGRCWLFTGLNVLRSKMIDKYNLGVFTLSQSYVFFYDQLEKANLFLQSVIDTRKEGMESRKVSWLFKHPLNDGGQFTGVADLVAKYGIVPSSVMPETYSANNTSQMSFLLNYLLRKNGIMLRDVYASFVKKGLKGKEAKVAEEKVLAQMEKMKIVQLKDVYHVLCLCLGVPPTKFEYSMYNVDNKLISTKEYTPLSFYKEYLGLHLKKDYVMLMNDPTRAYNKVYEIDLDRHVYDGKNWKFINLPMDKIKEMAIASIKDNSAMYFSCDVGKFLDSDKGVLDIKNYNFNDLLGVNLDMDKYQRVITNASGSTHAMTLIAVDIKNDKPVKWMVENSWGEKNGYKGNLIMTDKWFDGYMFRLVVNKKYVPQDILKLLEQKPIMLPAWDPMFSEDK